MDKRSETAPVIIRLSSTHVSEFRQLLQLFHAVFEPEHTVEPDESYLQHLLEERHFIIFIALAEEKVIGGLTAYVLPQYHIASSAAYIYDLAVDGLYQRKGVGRALIDELLRYSKSNGFREVFVQADHADAGALAFYRTTGGEETAVHHFTYSLI